MNGFSGVIGNAHGLRVRWVGLDAQGAHEKVDLGSNKWLVLAEVRVEVLDRVRV